MNLKIIGKTRSLRKLMCLITAFMIAITAMAIWPAPQAVQAEGRGTYDPYRDSKLMEVDGVTYHMKSQLTTILLMGVDNRGLSEDHSGFRSGGQADFLRLIVIDDEAKTISQLQIDRDTMTPITMVSVMGKPTGTRVDHISLSHGFGDGKEQSCDFTCQAVSTLLFDTPINFYLALNMDGINALNDAVGGVTVTIEDDFSEFDASMVPGATVTLHGTQAELFVRSRMAIGDGTNISRMRRQEHYIRKLAELVDARIRESNEFVNTIYDGVKDYLTTNMARGRIINEVWKIRDYQRVAVYSPMGEHGYGEDGFAEFHVDQEDLQRIVLEMFYEPNE